MNQEQQTTVDLAAHDLNASVEVTLSRIDARVNRLKAERYDVLPIDVTSETPQEEIDRAAEAFTSNTDWAKEFLGAVKDLSSAITAADGDLSKLNDDQLFFAAELEDMLQTTAPYFDEIGVATPDSGLDMKANVFARLDKVAQISGAAQEQREERQQEALSNPDASLAEISDLLPEAEQDSWVSRMKSRATSHVTQR